MRDAGRGEPRELQASRGTREAEDRDALAVIASVHGIGPGTLDRLLEGGQRPSELLRAARRPGGIREIRNAGRSDGIGRSVMSEAVADRLVAAARAPEAVLESMDRAGVHALAFDDRAYPRRLREIALPPRVLFVRGSNDALDPIHSVAVVGTRRPTDGGRRTARRIASALTRAGALVVSGLAIGIDGEAHAAVVAESGPTVAVIGGGHARLAPASHDRLAEAIVAGGGAVISEHAPGTEPTRGTFPRRNRLISGLADAVVVIEAGARSGSLLTAAWALEQGRECFFVPDTIDAPQSAGSLAWLRDYAGVARIVSGVPQLLEDLGLVLNEKAISVPDLPSRPAGVTPPALGARLPSIDAQAASLADREGTLLRAIARGAATADELAAVTRLPIGAVLGGLTALESAGLIEGRYGRVQLAGSS
ncbi:MAG: DNA-processing protein DprA [Candidatus Limnocylindrales bacterium]